MGGKDDVRAEKPPPVPDRTAFSNSIRLTGREWLGLGLFAGLLVLLAPAIWERLEPFAVDADYRMPHDLGNDYWLYKRYADLAAERYDTIVIGDSVVWGEYATRRETLSHYLNEQAGEERYVNLGLDGAHPLALEGLVRHYTSGIAGKGVLLQCNLLWLSSAKADLQDDKATEFNHPRLVRQFIPRIPSYKEEVSPRLGTVVEQRSPFSQWTNHLQQAYYHQTDIPSWTLEHPYDNPVKPLTRGLPPADEGRRHLAQPWYKSGITVQDFPWVDPETSLQWHAFQRVVAVLQQRGNRVFVLVGPFNEYLLTPASLERYQHIKATVAAWLEAQHVSYAIPPPDLLSRDQFGDASHPLASGYADLAGWLREEGMLP
jgi:hypothetical protein